MLLLRAQIIKLHVIEEKVMKKQILIITTCLLVSFNTHVLAGDYLETEIDSREIKLSKDGTGIIKFRQCDNNAKCKNVLVSITPETKGVLNGVEMGLLQAKKLSMPGFVGLLYKRDSKEAVSIGFWK